MKVPHLANKVRHFSFQWNKLSILFSHHLLAIDNEDAAGGLLYAAALEVVDAESLLLSLWGGDLCTTFF